MAQVSYKKIAVADVTTPPTGYVSTFVDSADGKLKQIDSDGTVLDVQDFTGSSYLDFGLNDSSGSVAQPTNLDYTRLFVEGDASGLHDEITALCYWTYYKGSWFKKIVTVT